MKEQRLVPRRKRGAYGVLAGKKTLKKSDHLEDRGVDGKNNIKMVFKYENVKCGLYYSGAGYFPLEDSYERCSISLL